MSLLDYGPCDACADGAVFETFAEGCAVCGRPDPRDEPELLERPRAVVRQSDDWPVPTSRPRPRDPVPPSEDS